MPIDTLCPSCRAKLRISDEYAGQQARCPVCQTIYAVPEASSPSPPINVEEMAAVAPPADEVPALVAPPAQDDLPDPVATEQVSELPAASDSPSTPLPEPTDPHQWFLRTPEGPIYGPVAPDVFERWVQEGRVTPDCAISAGDHRWRAAAELFPSLTNPIPVPVMPIKAESWRAGERPHRGPLILILGILSIITTCPIPGIMAWVMGSADLADMQAGRMDASGQGATQAGRFLGMAFSMVYIVGAVIAMFVLLLVAARG